jgi:hypothetical protein
MQTAETITVGVVAVRRVLSGPWADHDWHPEAVLETPPELAPGTRLAAEPGREQFYLGPLELTLHRKETESYRFNLATGEPRLYIALRAGKGPAGLPISAFQVTAAPDEAQAWAEVGDDVVDGVPMPGAIAAWLASFIERFHVEQPFIKRQRVPAKLDRGRGERGRQ